MELLPETKYVYPEHVTGVTRTASSQQPFQPTRLPSRESALSKPNETTAGLQNYLRSLQQKQKDYINEQIDKERRQPGERGLGAPSTYSSQASNANVNSKWRLSAADSQPQGMSLLKSGDLEGIRGYAHEGTGVGASQQDDYLFNIRKKKPSNFLL